MENKNNSNLNSSNINSSNNSNSNSSPFPKLKPTGSIYIQQNPLKEEEKTNENTKKEKDSNKEKEKDFFSLLKIFDPSANLSHFLKHSKSLNTENDKDGLKKLGKKHSSCEINDPSIEHKNEIKEENIFSVRTSLLSAKKLFQNFGGYINDNIINKINFNFNKTDNLDINFEKPANFGEIEKYWNYVKLLLDYNILDFGSKFIKINYYFLFFSYL